VKEPILRPEDHEAWAYWQRVCAVHARSPGFQRRVTQAKRYVLEALDLEPHACVMWSGGKDSTCLAHLVTHELGLTHVQLISQKDDLDYPDEEAYVRELAARWGAQLEVLRPEVSMRTSTRVERGCRAPCSTISWTAPARATDA
jgi:3'-phosphoadenosine 5'-phosphosulfate sulfotransferase (PAPS reductase)/FAD synthetase